MWLLSYFPLEIFRTQNPFPLDYGFDLKLLDIRICWSPDLHVGGQSCPLGLYSEYIGEWVCVKIFFSFLMMFKVNVLGAIEIVIPDIGSMTFVFGV